MFFNSLSKSDFLQINLIIIIAMISVIMVIYLYLLDLGIVKILLQGCKNIKKH